MGAFPDESFTSLRNRDRGARNPLDGRGGVKVFAVFNNIPNPFVGTTTVSYQLPSESDVSLIVYNVAGEVVSCLVDERRGPGVYFASWDGRDSFGREVASGVYFYRFEAGNYSKTMKMLRVK
jgi:flagellar hook assembly protein FlgD